jgi:hypothetical protein
VHFTWFAGINGVGLDGSVYLFPSLLLTFPFYWLLDEGVSYSIDGLGTFPWLFFLLYLFSPLFPFASKTILFCHSPLRGLWSLLYIDMTFLSYLNSSNGYPGFGLKI